MREITGNLWDHNNADSIICITTNGFVKKNGEAVLGRGCAYEATQRIPGIAKRLGEWIITNGNVPCWLTTGLVTFPVKRVWWEKADLKLIEESAAWLRAVATETLPGHKFILPRPGCGNGQLAWADVKPLLLSLPDNVFVIDFAKNEGGQWAFHCDDV